MKNLLYICLSGVIVVFGSCGKIDNLSYIERRAVGQYKFEKVVLHDDFLSTRNVTQDYNNMILQLNDKKEAALIDQNNSITYLGKYEIVTQTNSNISDDEGNSGTTDDHTRYKIAGAGCQFPLGRRKCKHYQ